jgi:hypothetical protein
MDACCSNSYIGFSTTDQEWTIEMRDMYGRKLPACMNDGHDINTGYWNGTYWIWTDELELVASSYTRRSFDLSPDLFCEKCWFVLLLISLWLSPEILLLLFDPSLLQLEYYIVQPSSFRSRLPVESRPSRHCAVKHRRFLRIRR